MRRTLFLLLSLVTIPFHVSAQRLPALAVPESYQLIIEPNFAREDFTGEETVQIRVLNPTSEIVLNSADIEFRGVTITAGSAVQKAKVTIDKPKEMAVLAVDQPILPGPATIFIRYRGVFNGELRGFYLSRVGGRKYAITQFEATDARRAFPCFDEPAYKATFDITIVTDQGLTAISNGKVISDTPGPGTSQHSVHFSTTPKMSSYLVALAVGEFESIAGEADGVPIRIWTTAGRKGQAAFALEVAKQSLRFFDRYLEIKYPFEKLDLIEVPDFASEAMENTAAIIFRDSELLVDPDSSSLDTQKEAATTIAHEISHQWFGDLVTMAWWDDIWLNEGFANWLQSKAISAWKPEWHTELDDVEDAQKALEKDAFASIQPVRQSAETPEEINELFDSDIAYRKAAAVLRMVEHYVGPEIFRSGVNQYLRQHAYGNATSQDFWHAIASVSDQAVINIGAGFINQPGVPLVSVNAGCANGSTNVTLFQQRYFADSRAFTAGSGDLWAIPICMKFANEKSGTPSHQQCRLLTARRENFAIPGCAPWGMVNSQSNGYYRSAYESDALREISGVFATNFDSAERVSLVSDAWASVPIGKQSVGNYLEFAQVLRDERNPVVTGELTERLEYIADYLVTDSDRAAFQNWLRQLLRPAAQELGWKPAAGESNDRKLLRAQVLYALGHSAGDPQVLEEARRLAHRALADPALLDSTLSSTVFALAAENGNSSFYDKIMRRMQNTSSGEEYSLLMNTLPRFRDPKLLLRTLQFALTPDVRSSDLPKFMAEVLESPAGQKTAWDFLRAHWDQVGRAVGEFGSIALVKGTGAFCETALRGQVREFFTTHPVPAAERTLKQSLEQMDFCIDLKTQQTAPLQAWLARQTGPRKK